MGDNMEIIKSLKLIFKYLHLSFKITKEYKIELFYAFFVSLTNIIGFPIVWFLLTNGGSNHLNTWHFHHLIFLSIVLSIIYSFLDLIGLWDVWKLVFSEGRTVILRYLTRPANFYLQLFGEHFFVGDLIRIFLYILILAYITINENIPIYNILAFFLFFLFGFTIMVLLLLIPINLFLIYDQSTRGLPDLLWGFLSYAGLPIDNAKEVVYFFLHYIVPIAFIAVVPAKSFFEGFSIDNLFSYFLVISCLFLINKYLWNIAVKRFEAIGG
jgi:ABC-type uncharacterized transport system permease subunit